MADPIAGKSVPPEPKPAGLFTTHATRLLVWIVCSVLLALFPPILQGLNATLFEPSVQISGDDASFWLAFLRAASEKGELLLISGALTAAMIGEMYSVEHADLKRWRAIVGVLSLLIFAACVFFFPIAPKIAAKSAWFSVIMLLASVAISGAGVVVASIDREHHV